MAKTLIENLAATWDPERYHDNYRSELLELLQRKAEGAPLPKREEEGEGEVVDLMEALRQSVEATKRKRRKAPARKAS
jgi:DNA end-binding protein Ku